MTRGRDADRTCSVVPDAGRAWQPGARMIDRRRDACAGVHDGNARDACWSTARPTSRASSPSSTRCQRGDWVHFTDWRGDPDERLDGPGTEVARVLAGAGRTRRAGARPGLAVPPRPGALQRGGEPPPGRDGERGRRRGAARRAGPPRREPPPEAVRRPPPRRRPTDDVAFVGGIDLCHGRRDDERHQGDDQAIDLDPRYGPRPPWHDMQARGARAGGRRRGLDVPRTVGGSRRRSTTATRGGPGSPRRRPSPRRPDPLPPAPPDPPPAGRTPCRCCGPTRRSDRRIPFAPDGERSIARAYLKAFAAPGGWSTSRTSTCGPAPPPTCWPTTCAIRARACTSSRSCPATPTATVASSGPPYRIGQQRAVRAAPPGRRRPGARSSTSRRRSGWPIYVHAKVCIVDDVVDDRRAATTSTGGRGPTTPSCPARCSTASVDERAPIDPGGLGDGARVLARETRLRLWCEHLGRDRGDVEDLVDGVAGIEVPLLRRSADELDAWQRPWPRRAAPAWPAAGAPPRAGAVVGAAGGPGRCTGSLVDPDGRPRHLRRADRF